MELTCGLTDVLVLGLAFNRNHAPVGHQRAVHPAPQCHTTFRQAGLFWFLGPATHLRLITAVMDPMEPSQGCHRKHAILPNFSQPDPEIELVLVLVLGDEAEDSTKFLLCGQRGEGAGETGLGGGVEAG